MSLGTGDWNGKTQDAERDLGVNLHVFFRGLSGGRLHDKIPGLAVDSWG
ncbi:MAG: hypothetical protein Q4B97_10685 [Lachnospiraceae bacterium]|nr:hypothetical protein [Lachnospiraceae bacterium]